MYIGTLEDLVKCNYKWSDIGDEKEVLFQVTKGLAYLHEKGIIHRDIKPTTIFIDNKKKLMKLGYFGICSTLLEDKHKPSDSSFVPLGTLGWISPELFDSGSYDFKVDIFTLGCIFSYTLTDEAKHPFGKYPIQQSVRIQKKDDKMSLELEDFKSSYRNDSDIGIIKLIQSMCKMKPEERPEAKQILEDDFFTELKRNEFRTQTDDLIYSQASATRQSLEIHTVPDRLYGHSLRWPLRECAKYLFAFVSSTIFAIFKT